ncbi:MAG TPA: FGGY family carbohydrate kinase [Terriglobales bacterium]|nr:FGGY family carbohydrate kinase [Terriglobales bacterium]
MSKEELVVGLDSSTTATKAIAWRRNGSIAGTGRARIGLARLSNNRFEQDAEDWWLSASTALRELGTQVDPGTIVAIAISNQRETFVPLGADCRPVRPAIVWLDQRCEEEVAWLAGCIGHERIHRISGKPPDMGPVAYRIAWMMRNEPQLFRQSRMFADVHTYLAWRLTGEFRTSWASADPLGLFDLECKRWSPEILEALELSAEQLPQTFVPGSVIGKVTAAAAGEAGLCPGTKVVAGGGDGQAAGLGAHTLNPETAYLNLGTAVVSGVYSREYRIGLPWRTMGSCTGEGYYLETSLRSGSMLMDWFAHDICGSSSNATLHAQLEEEAKQIPIGSEGLLALPYWGAVMTPYWDADARGCFVGLSSSHRRAHLYRALLEGIALEQALVTGMIEEATGQPIKAFQAIGGGAANDLWCQIMADASGKVVRRSSSVEASSLGVALCAAVAAQWFNGFREAAEAMCSQEFRETAPQVDYQQRYCELMAVYRELYPNLKHTFKKLAKWRG